MRNTLSDCMRTFSQAARLMIRQRRFFLVTVLILALGIGVCTALFSVMYSVLLKPLPVQQQDRLVVGWKGDPKDVAHVGELSYPEFQDWQRQSKAFERMAAMPTTLYGYGLTLTGYGEPVELERTPVTGAFFALLGVRPALGRTFEESDNHPGAEATVVLHYSLWKNRFNADPTVIGRTVSLSGQGYTIIGVMPSDFDFPAGAQLWTPLGLEAKSMKRDATFLQVIGRLKSGVSLQQSRNDVGDLIAHVAQQYPQYSEAGEFAKVTPLTDHVFGNNKPAIVLLWAASLLLLAIACTNICSILVARAMIREKEIAVRLALGATRRSLLHQFVAEGLVLSSAGAIGGCIFASVFLNVVLQLAPEGIPRLSSVNLNVFSFLFACITSVVIAVTLGLVPLFFMMKRDVSDSLNEGGARTAGSRKGVFFRRALLAAEAAVTMLLLTSAGMVIHNFYNLQRVRLGFVPENTLTAQVNLPNVDTTRRKAFFSELLSRLQSHAVVSAAGGVLLRPFEGNIGWDVPYKIRGQDVYEAKRNAATNFEVATPGYFKAAGTPLLAGRYFAPDDNDKNQNVAIISESLARKAFGNVRQSIGKQIRLGSPDAPDEEGGWCTVVGVVADAQYRKLGVTQGDAFIPFLQTDIPVRYIIIRTSVNPASLVLILRQEVSAIDKDVAVSKVGTMEQLIAGVKMGPRFSMLLFSMFGVFAGFLASVGVYGLVSDSVVQRRREIGIRMALGAQPADVLSLMMRGEMSAVVLGGVSGFLFSLGMIRLYAHLLYGLEGIDFLSPATAFAILISVSLATSIVPMMTATRARVTELLAE